MRKFAVAIVFLATLFLQGASPYVETAAVTSAWTTICELSTHQMTNVSFGVHNTGATNPFTDCVVESWVGPDVAADWAVISSSWADCKSLAAGATTSWDISGIAYTRMRVRVKSTVGTSAYCRQAGSK